jgi:hypothetical protein
MWHSYIILQLNGAGSLMPRIKRRLSLNRLPQQVYRNFHLHTHTKVATVLNRGTSSELHTSVPIAPPSFTLISIFTTLKTNH